MNLENIRTEKDFNDWFFNSKIPIIAQLKAQNNQNMKRLEGIEEEGGYNNNNNK